MNSTTAGQKRTDSKTNHHVEREIHSVPAEWARQGCHQPVPDHCARFYCEQVAVEHRVTAEHVGPSELSYRERETLLVLYRNPDTGEAVVRQYQATTRTTDRPHVAVPHPNPDGEGRRDPGEWGRVAYDALPHPTSDDHRVIPTIVADGEPSNFRASIAVSPAETRVDA